MLAPVLRSTPGQVGKRVRWFLAQRAGTISPDYRRTYGHAYGRERALLYHGAGISSS